MVLLYSYKDGHFKKKATIPKPEIISWDVNSVFEIPEKK